MQSTKHIYWTPTMCLALGINGQHKQHLPHNAYKKIGKIRSGMRACDCPSYLGNGDRKIIVWDQPRQKLERPYLRNRLVVVPHICDLSYLGGRVKRIIFQGWVGKNGRGYLEKQAESSGLGLWLQW
jgi:hypothetical protein